MVPVGDQHVVGGQQVPDRADTLGVRDAFPHVLDGAAVGVVCVVVYLGVLVAVRAPEITMATGLVRARIRR